jgi:hypothetical protein
MAFDIEPVVLDKRNISFSDAASLFDNPVTKEIGKIGGDVVTGLLGAAGAVEGE